MSPTFSADDLFAIAQQIERNGSKFYRKAAQQNAAARDLLTLLAGQEDQHLATFTDLRSHLKSLERDAQTYDPSGESAQYLQALADRRVFDVDKDPSTLLTGKESAAEIIGIAIGLEKESIAFYASMKALVPAKSGHDKMDLIIREEIRHIAFLNKAFQDLC